MKKITLGVFSTREMAESAIKHLQDDVKLDTESISYVYRNSKGEVREVDTDNVGDQDVSEGAKKGAWIGAGAGTLAGIAAVVGMIPVLGPVFAAGPLLASVGIGGAVGTAAAGAVTGAVAGGLIGVLVTLGLSEDTSKKYEDYVMAGDILVIVYADEEVPVKEALLKKGSTEVETFTPKI